MAWCGAADAPADPLPGAAASGPGRRGPRGSPGPPAGSAALSSGERPEVSQKEPCEICIYNFVNYFAKSFGI